MEGGLNCSLRLIGENMSTTSTEKPECKALNRPYILAKNTGEHRAYAFRPGCGLWTCPACREELKREWVLIALTGAQSLINSGHALGFITVTARGGKGRTQERSVSQFAVAWPKLARRAKYHGCGVFEYLLVPELHQNGVIHYHLIGTNTLKQKWWKDNAFEVGLGYMAKVKPLQDVGWVVWYVSKYLGKDLGRQTWPEGLRRVRTSRGWPREVEFDDPRPWEYEVYKDKNNLFWEVHILEDSGWVVTMSEAVKGKQA